MELKIMNVSFKAYIYSDILTTIALNLNPYDDTSTNKS